MRTRRWWAAFRVVGMTQDPVRANCAVWVAEFTLAAPKARLGKFTPRYKWHVSVSDKRPKSWIPVAIAISSDPGPTSIPDTVATGGCRDAVTVTGPATKALFMTALPAGPVAPVGPVAPGVPAAPAGPTGP